MDADTTFAGLVNIGNPNKFPMWELACWVLKHIGESSKLVFHSLPTGDPKQHQSDITFAKNAFARVPKLQLEVGLKETIRYFRKLFSA
jgi:UDP-glucuronate decarboxylase